MSPRAQWIRQVLLLTVAAVAGVGLAVLAVGMLASRGCSRADPGGQTLVVEAQADADSSGRPADRPGDPPVDPAAATETDADQPVDEGQSEPEAAPAEQEPPTAGGPEDAKPTSSADTEVPFDAEPPADPTAMDDPDVPAGAPKKSAIQKEPGGEPATGEPVEPPADVDPPAEPPAKPQTPPARAAPAVDVDQQLALAVLGIEFENMELADFADFISELAAIPVTLDIDSIRAQGLDLDTPLSVDLRGVTIRQIVEAALQEPDLAYAVQDNQFVITAPETLTGEVEEATLGIADLIADEARASMLAEFMVTQLAPDSWQRAGGAGTLSQTGQAYVVQQAPAVLVRIVRLLDRLRTAQGLLPRSELPAEQVAVEPLFQQAAEKLNQPLSVNFAAPVPLARVLSFLEGESGFRILVDWRSLAGTGWTPRSEATLIVDGEPFAQALARWLQPAGLEYRVLDTQTLQIGSQEAIKRRLEVECYRVPGEPDPAEVERWIGHVKRTVGASYFASEPHQSAVWYDAGSRCLLVSLPQPLQRKVASALPPPPDAEPAGSP